jgi:hypothetical protein
MTEQRNQDNFQASLRLPALTCVHVTINAFISVCVALDQVW